MERQLDNRLFLYRYSTSCYATFTLLLSLRGLHLID